MMCLAVNTIIFIQNRLICNKQITTVTPPFLTETIFLIKMIMQSVPEKADMIECVDILKC